MKGKNLLCIDLDRAPTGVEYLDEILEGGFPRGASILIAGNPGAGKTTFAATFLYRGALSYNEPGLYVSLVEDKHSFYSYMSTLGLDFEELERRDLFTFFGVPYADIGKSIESLVYKIIQIVKKKNVKRVVVDSISAIAQALKTQERVRAFIHNTFIYGLKKLGGTGITTLLVADLPHGASVIGLGVEEFLVDGVLVLKVERIEGMVIRYLELWKMRGTKIGRTLIPFTLGSGGFKPVIPTKLPPIVESSTHVNPVCCTTRKLFVAIPLGSLIVVEGEPGSGKSTLVSEIALDAAVQGYRVLYVSFEESGDSVLNRIKYVSKKCLGLSTAEMLSRIHIVSVNPYQFEITDLMNTIFENVEKLNPLLTVFDDMEVLAPLEMCPAFLSMMRCFIDAVRRSGRIVAIVIDSRAVRKPCIVEGLADLMILTSNTENPSKKIVKILKSRTRYIKNFATVMSVESG